jgi:8-oxo-dGTP diphosphatase
MSDVPCVGAVIFDAVGRLLLVKRANPPAQGTWSIPGGRVEVGETDEQAVVREVHEETGLRVTVVREVGTVLRDGLGGNRYLIRDFLCAQAVAVDPPASRDAFEPTAGDDAADAMFVPVDQLSSLELSPGLVEALSEWGLLAD